jgi:hypothetical protein
LHQPSSADGQSQGLLGAAAGRWLIDRASQGSRCSTNTAGIRCWQRNGFQVVGTLPGAFRHKQLGYVDALVRVQTLVEGASP